MSLYTELSEGQSGKKPKSFWKKPEGITGIIFLGGLFAGGLWLWDKVLPWLIRIAENTLYLGILLVALAALVYVLLSPEFRTGMFYLFKMAMRAITGLIIRIDPIAILKVYVDDMKKNRQILDQQINNLARQEGKLRKQIEDNNSNIKDLLAKAAKAREKGLANEAVLYSTEAGGLQGMNETFKPLYDRIVKMLKFLEKILEGTDFQIRKTEIQVRQMEMEYNVVKGSLNALRSALHVFKGDPDKRRVFETAAEFIADDVGAKLGEIKRAMELSQGFINGIDIEHGVMTDKAKSMLEAYETGEFTLVTITDTEVPKSAQQPALQAGDDQHIHLLN